jgi:plastocyanin
MSKLAIAAIVGIVMAVTAVAFSYEPEKIVGAGKITGVVRYKGPAFQPSELEISKDREVCGTHPLYDQSLVVGKDAGIANAVVTIADISKGEPLKRHEDVKFDQKGCEYTPRVIAFPAGSTIGIINSDGILHNIHTESAINPVVDMAQPGFKKIIKVTVEKPEAIKVTCDAHNWMVGWWYATDNPYYAVTDATGHFTLDNVPPGTYTLQAWQERLGTTRQKVAVRTGATASTLFTMGPKKNQR